MSTLAPAAPRKGGPITRYLRERVHFLRVAFAVARARQMFVVVSGDRQGIFVGGTVYGASYSPIFYGLAAEAAAERMASELGIEASADHDAPFPSVFPRGQQAQAQA